ncbi:FkbM family methyltransferase [Micromonospora sp. NPDC050980]|uniref:FkbM family methyltransferase n=1 Tax=Micromonospora sp. NPDC050980 TaxID=3155161 RepID=UPI0033E0099C
MPLIHRRLPTGQEVAQVDAAEAALIYREIFVEHSYDPPGFPAVEPRVIVDVGANIGLASMYFKQRFPDAVIVAAEPGPDTFRALAENFARHIPGGSAHQVAVSSREGTARFGYYPQAPAESGLYTDPGEEIALAKQLMLRTGFAEREAERFSRQRHRIQYVETPTTTLSKLIRDAGVDTVDLLKVDVERAERDVLAGIAEEDWPRIGQLVLEVHDVDGRLAEVDALLHRHGFRTVVTQEERLSDTSMHMVFGTRPA